MTATAYLGATEVTDPDTDTGTSGNLTGTRFYALGGATVATRTGNSLSFLLGDVQGSAQVMVTHTVDPSTGALNAITEAVVSRNVYTPYGTTRGQASQSAGNDALAISHGWLNQVSDEASTGLVYLNARYYDPVVSRFLSPDPLMDPENPRTLDPYMYAADNPVAYTDSTGLCYTGTAARGYVGGVLEDRCSASNYTSTTSTYKHVRVSKAKRSRPGFVSIAAHALAGVALAGFEHTQYGAMYMGFQSNVAYMRDPEAYRNGVRTGIRNQISQVVGDARRLADRDIGGVMSARVRTGSSGDANDSAFFWGHTGTGGVLDALGASIIGPGAGVSMEARYLAGEGEAAVAANATARRVSLRSGVKAEIRASAKRNADGDFIDPNTHQVIPKGGPYDYGHVYGKEWWRTKQKADAEGWTRKEVIDYENNPSHYQIEDPSSNRSRKWEQVD